MSLTQSEQARIEKAVRPFPQRRSGLLPALHVIQESRGHIDQQAMIDVAEYFDLHPMQVEEVVTFYTMFQTRPIGRYHLQVCRSVSCFIMGSNGVLRGILDRLGIGPGETTADRCFTLSTVECLGSCGTAPVMQVNDDYHEDLNEEKLDRLLDQLSES